MTNGPLFKFSRPVRGTREEGEGAERVDAFPAISTQDFRPTTEFRSVFLILFPLSLSPFLSCFILDGTSTATGGSGSAFIARFARLSTGYV